MTALATTGDDLARTLARLADGLAEHPAIDGAVRAHAERLAGEIERGVGDEDDVSVTVTWTAPGTYRVAVSGLAEDSGRRGRRAQTLIRDAIARAAGRAP